MRRAELRIGETYDYLGEKVVYLGSEEQVQGPVYRFRPADFDPKLHRARMFNDKALKYIKKHESNCTSGGGAEGPASSL